MTPLMLWLLLAPRSLAQDDLRGTWTRSDVGGRQQAIDAVVADMPFWRRGAAKRRLRSATQPCSVLEISGDVRRVSVRCDQHPVVVDVTDGEPIAWTDTDGSEYQVSLEWRGDALVQTFTAEDGSRTHRYTASGDTLRLESELRSAQLPRAVAYVDLYRATERGPAEPSAMVRAAGLRPDRAARSRW